MKRFDLSAYAVLIAGIIAATIIFWLWRYNQTKQLLVIFALVIFYLLWGLLYHFTRRDLTKKLFLEYLLLGLICSGVGILVFYL